MRYQEFMSEISQPERDAEYTALINAVPITNFPLTKEVLSSYDMKQLAYAAVERVYMTDEYGAWMKEMKIPSLRRHYGAISYCTFDAEGQHAFVKAYAAALHSFSIDKAKSFCDMANNALRRCINPNTAMRNAPLVSVTTDAIARY